MAKKLFEWWDNLKLIWKILIIGALIIAYRVLFIFFDFLTVVWCTILFGSGLITVFFGIDYFINSDDYKTAGSSSDSYSGGSGSYSNDLSSSSSDSTITESDLVEAIRNDLHSKGTSAVAIYHSPFVSQWYLVDYWGVKHYVTYVRTGYGEKDYFETRDGKRYVINDITPNRDKIYYFS